MKQVILANVRVTEDEKTKERLVFATFLNLPNKGNDGRIWNPKKEDLISVSCFGEDRAQSLYNMLRRAVPGTLLGVSYGFNERTNKPFVTDVKILKVGYTEAEIFEPLPSEENPATDNYDED